jgi:peroxiredoxin
MKSISKTFISFAIAGLGLTAIAGPKPAPSFSLAASDGKTYTLKSLSHGKPLLLIFLSAGCPHNAHGIEDFNRLQSMFSGKINVAGMVNLNDHQAKALSKLDRARFPILSDQMAGVIGKFGGHAGLDNALILPNGEVAHLWHGYDQTTLAQVETLLKRNHGMSLNLDLSRFPKSRQSGCAIGMNM